MRFPKFWAKGSHDGFECWQWSDSSLAEAAALGQAAARRIAEMFASTGRPDRAYGYAADRPLREPILREVTSSNGESVAVITRNAYGSLILNTANVMFVDVDLPEPKPSGGWWQRLFGQPAAAHPNHARERVLALAAAWTERNPGWGWRVYRTRAGLRLLATHTLFDPAAPATEQVFEAMSADPLYRRLCRTQKCFRARLSPKPWRCEVGKPPGRWPWPDAAAQERFERWERGYLEASTGYATCAFIRSLGNPNIDATVRLILDIHDPISRADSTLALA